MARLPRLSLPGLPHYVWQAGVHGQCLAHDSDDRQALLAALQDAARTERTPIWAYAVLPQELHLLVCPPQAQSLGRVMQALGRRYVAGFNRRHQRQGALWGGRFRAAIVEPGDWLLSAMCRIDGLDTDVSACSSAAHHVGEQRDSLLSDPAEWWQLGNTPFERESAYRALLSAGLAPAREQALARAVHGTWVAGSSAFAEQVASQAGRPALPRRPGRPPRGA